MARDFAVSESTQSFLNTVRAAYSRRLPPRYARQWRDRFQDQLRESMVPGVSILDIGAGVKPTIAAGDRPPNTTYVGMDVSAEELAKAPAGSYDETLVAPVERRIPGLDGRFDLCVSWLAFEHVRHVDAALSDVFSYLRPGGRTIIQMAGRFSLFSLLNRLLPNPVGKKVVQLTQKREPESIFPAIYDHCSYRDLSRLLRNGGWAEWDVEPLFLGADYVLFSKPLTAVYVGYEEWAYRRGHANLAPHYLLTARREGPSPITTDPYD